MFARRSFAWGLSVVGLVLLCTAGRVGAQGGFILDFDDTGPTVEDELLDFFTFLGFEPDVGTNWTIQDNFLSPDPSQALRTNSDGNQLVNYFSRVAIITDFEAENVEISADITWDDNDSAGLYVRFIGEEHDPLLNDYYFVRGEANGSPGNVHLHRVKDGVHVELASGGPAIAQGDTHKFTVRAVDDQIFVLVDDEPIPGMDPFIDPDPILDLGRVGVGQETNPGYYDNIEVLPEAEFEPFPCSVNRSVSGRYEPGDTLTVTLSATSIRGPTTITDTFPNGWTVTDNGGGTVAGNTITFSVDADGEVAYDVAVPADFCEDAEFTGTYAGEGNCEGDVRGDSSLICLEPAMILYLPLDDEADTTVNEAGEDGILFNAPEYVDGQVGAAALLFDGISNYVEIPEDLSPQAPGNEGQMSICAWVQVLATALDTHSQDRQPIVMKGNSGEWEYALYVYDNFGAGMSVWQCGGNGVSEPSAGGTLNQDEWHHVCGTWDVVNGVTVYVDALEVAQRAPDAGEEPCDGTRSVFIAHREDGQYLNAIVDDVAMWNYELSPDDVLVAMEDGPRAVLEDPGPDLPRFRRGDCNEDGTVNITDAVCILNFLFGGNAEVGCLAAVDTTGEGEGNITDAVSLLNFLFAGGADPAAPFPDCGTSALPTDECENPPANCQ